jgi:hypothetical protein
MLAPVWPPVDSGQMPGEIFRRSATLSGLAWRISSRFADTML